MGTKWTILVAGATGAIGRPLVRLLLQRGHRVAGTTRRIDRADALADASAMPFVADAFVHDGIGEEARFTTRAGETLLEGGLREGLALPFDCRNGACGICLCTVSRGMVAHRPYQPGALPDHRKALGQALMCCAMPLDDVAVEIDAAVRSGRKALHEGQVVTMDRLAEDVMRLHDCPQLGA